MLKWITGDTVHGHALYNAELHYQLFVLENGRVGWFWIVGALVLLVPALITALMVLGLALGAVFAPLFVIERVPVFPPTGIFGNGLLLMWAMAIAADVVISLVATALAANAFSRERRGHTWDLLVLTGIPARRLVLGKWWAALGAMRRDYRVLATLRVGLVCWAFVGTGGLLGYSLIQTLLALLAAILLTLAFTRLDAMLTAATAMLGALSTTLPDRVPGGLGFVYRGVAFAMLIGLQALLIAGSVGGSVPLNWLFLLVPLVGVLTWFALLPLTLTLAMFAATKQRATPLNLDQ